MAGIFVIGVDTGVGKTVISAGLLQMLHGSRKLAYWKPVQTGTIVGDDTVEVRNLTQLPEEEFVEPTYRFTDPLSPHVAAKKWGKTIELAVLKKVLDEQEARGTFVIVEGAGGVLVPFSDTDLQIDFIKMSNLPVLIVAQDRVGAINQTLLTLAVLREQKIPIAGVVLTRSRGQFSNGESIRQFGKTEILAEIQPSDDKRSLVAMVGAHQGLRRYFKIPILPA